MDLTKLTSQLILHEGLKTQLYKDTEGFDTIGVGHNLSAKGLTHDQCVYILKDDISDTLSFLAAHCPWFQALDDVRQRAIADLTFDLMGKVLTFHNMIAAIQTQDWGTAANELLNSEFARQAPNRAHDLAYQLRTGQDVS